MAPTPSDQRSKDNFERADEVAAGYLELLLDGTPRKGLIIGHITSEDLVLLIRAYQDLRRATAENLW